MRKMSPPAEWELKNLFATNTSYEDRNKVHVDSKNEDDRTREVGEKDSGADGDLFKTRVNRQHQSDLT